MEPSSTPASSRVTSSRCLWMSNHWTLAGPDPRLYPQITNKETESRQGIVPNPRWLEVSWAGAHLGAKELCPPVSPSTIPEYHSFCPHTRPHCPPGPHWMLLVTSLATRAAAPATGKLRETIPSLCSPDPACSATFCEMVEPVGWLWAVPASFLLPAGRMGNLSCRLGQNPVLLPLQVHTLPTPVSGWGALSSAHGPGGRGRARGHVSTQWHQAGQLEQPGAWGHPGSDTLWGPEPQLGLLREREERRVAPWEREQLSPQVWGPSKEVGAWASRDGAG